MSFTSSHYAVADDEAEAFWFLGDVATAKAGGEKTGGRLAVVEFKAPPGFATPYHVHHAEDEAFYVLEGSLTGVCGDTKWEAGVGSFVWLPKDVPHGYANTADGVTRSLAITLPSGFDEFVREIGEPAPSRTFAAAVLRGAGHPAPHRRLRTAPERGPRTARLLVPSRPVASRGMIGGVDPTRSRTEGRPVPTDEEGQYRVAVVQVPPVVLDRQATLARAVEKVGEAAHNGARLVAFSEAFVPGYPDWVWRLRPSDAATAADIWERLFSQAVDLERDELAPLREVARLRKVAVSVGINEREGRFSRSTVYNSVVVIGADGEIALRHRKLMATNAERMVWGAGDGVGLEAVETPVGRVAGLICWENYMPLARFALYASGVQVYLAPTWDMGERWVASMRHIAFEGGCWVLGCGSLMRAADIPDDLPMRAELYPDPEEWINHGYSVIVAPGGEIVAGPLCQAEGILYADCGPEKVSRRRRLFDVAGHYGRPDVFQVTVDRSARRPID